MSGTRTLDDEAGTGCEETHVLAVYPPFERGLYGSVIDAVADARGYQERKRL